MSKMVSIQAKKTANIAEMIRDGCAIDNMRVMAVIEPNVPIERVTAGNVLMISGAHEANDARSALMMYARMGREIKNHMSGVKGLLNLIPDIDDSFWDLIRYIADELDRAEAEA